MLGHQVKGRRVPEARGAAVAEQHLVAVGQVEKRRKTIAHFADLVANCCLSV